MAFAPGNAAERASESQWHQRHQEIATDHDCERQKKEHREGEPGEIGVSKPDDPAASNNAPTMVVAVPRRLHSMWRRLDRSHRPERERFDWGLGDPAS